MYVSHNGGLPAEVDKGVADDLTAEVTTHDVSHNESFGFPPRNWQAHSEMRADPAPYVAAKRR